MILRTFAHRRAVRVRDGTHSGMFPGGKPKPPSTAQAAVALAVNASRRLSHAAHSVARGTAETGGTATARAKTTMRQGMHRRGSRAWHEIESQNVHRAEQVGTSFYY